MQVRRLPRMFLWRNQIAAAGAGYRYFRLEAVSALIGRAPAVLGNDDDIDKLNLDDDELVPTDQVLAEEFVLR